MTNNANIVLNRKKISLIIPCFNEEQGIADTLNSILHYHQKNLTSKIDLEIIPVNDGSTDSTETILKKFEKEHNEVKPVYFPMNRGRGAAMKEGIKSSTGTYVMMLDADLSYDVHHIGKVIEKFESDDSIDAIVVSPYMKGGIAKNIPFNRLLLSKVANWILSGFFSKSISTVTSMVRGYKGDIIRMLPLLEEGKEIHLEILRKLSILDARIEEIPGQLVWKSKGGRRKISLKVASTAKKHILYGFLAKPTRFLTKISAVLFIVGIYELYNIGLKCLEFYKITERGFIHDLWFSLDSAFHHSPHTVVIAITCLFFALQISSYIAMLSIAKLQHEEKMKHILSIMAKES